MPAAPRLLLLLGLALAPWSLASASNGPATTSTGTKGLVTLAIDGDGQSMYHMPSSIGWNLRARVDLDLFYFYSTATMENSLNDFRSSSGTFGAAAGLVMPVGRPDFDENPDAWDDYTYKGKLTIGVGAYPAMSGGKEKSNIRLTTFPNGHEIKKGIQFIDVTFAAAYTVTEWLSVGVGLHVISSELDIDTLVGGSSTPLNGSPTIPVPGDPTYADFLDLLESDETSDPSTIFDTRLRTVQFAGTLSVSLRPLDNLGIGISWRPQSFDPFHFVGDAKIDARKTFELIDPTFRTLLLGLLPNGGGPGEDEFVGNYDVDITGIYVPQQIRFSVAFWPTETILLGLEVAWIEWAEAFKDTKVELTNGDNADLNHVIGSDSISTTLKSRWHNQWVISGYGAVGLGNFWAPAENWTARLGFNYGPTPFNEDRMGVAPNSGLSDFTLAFGLGWRINSNWEVSALIERSFYSEQTAPNPSDTLTGSGQINGADQWFFHGGFSYKF